MGDLWLPGVERVAGVSAGPMNADGSKKLLFHSTEGSSIEGAIATFQTRSSHPWSHLIVDCHERRAVQCVPLNLASRSLLHPAGTEETNRDGDFCVQIELVGSASDPQSIAAGDEWDWLGRNIVRPIVGLTGIPLVTHVHWVAYPASYGLAAPQRLTVADWDSYSGLLGHQHCPNNSHGDPGLIEIDRIIAAARPEEDDMTPQQAAQLAEVHSAVTSGRIATQVWTHDVAQLPTKTGAAADLMRRIRSMVGTDVDEAAVAAALAPPLVAAVVANLPKATTLTLDDVEAAAEAGLRDVLADAATPG